MLNSSLDLIPISEAKIDNMHAHIDMVQIIWEDWTIKSAYWVDKGKLPITKANTNVNVNAKIFLIVLLAGMFPRLLLRYFLIAISDNSILPKIHRVEFLLVIQFPNFTVCIGVIEIIKQFRETILCSVVR